MTRIHLVAALALGVVLSGCSKESSSSTSSKPEPATVAKSASTQGDDPAASASAYAATTTSYDSLRDALAKDDLEKSKSAATGLAKAARAAAASSGSNKAHLEGIAEAADKVAGGTDLAEQRQAFGDASKHLITLMVAVPALQKSRFVFMCPMAKGYKKWVQEKEKMENPYMGQKMLECGSKTEWKV